MAKKSTIHREIFGTLPNVVNYDGVLSWSKTGGYAGEKTLARIVQRALGAGYVKGDSHNTSSPDGSHMGGGDTYTGPHGERLRISSSYGVTKDKNRFNASLSING